MSLNPRRELILLKEEVTYNTDPTPTGAANAILCAEPNWSPEDVNLIERNYVKTSLAKEQSLYGGMLRSVTFKAEVKGSGAAGTAPEIGAALKCCAMTETVVGSTSVTYEPDSTAASSCTIYYYQDGLLYVITGARGEVSFSAEAGDLLYAEFTFTGHSAAPTDVALATGTFDTTLPEEIVGIPFTIAAYSSPLSKVEFTLGNVLSKPKQIQASDGFGELAITDRDVNGSFDPEHTLVATQDWEGIFRAGTTGAMSFGSIGAAAGNIVDIDMPVVAYRNVAPGARDNIRTLDLSFGAHESSSDDEVSIVFT